VCLIIPLPTLLTNIGWDLFYYDKALSGTIILPHLLGFEPAL